MLASKFVLVFTLDGVDGCPRRARYFCSLSRRAWSMSVRLSIFVFIAARSSSIFDSIAASLRLVFSSDSRIAASLAASVSMSRALAASMRPHS